MREGKSSSLSLRSLDIVFSSSSRRLEINCFFGSSSCSGGGGGGGGFGVRGGFGVSGGGGGFGVSGGGGFSVGSGLQPSSYSRFGDSTVDISSNINGTRDSSRQFITLSGRWFLHPLNSYLSNSSSGSNSSTIGSFSEFINFSHSSSTSNKFDSSVIIGFFSEWIWLDEHINFPFSLCCRGCCCGFGGGGGGGGGFGVSGCGGLKHSRGLSCCCGGGGGFGGVSGCGFGVGCFGVGGGCTSSFTNSWERWRWVTEVSTILIHDSIIWNSH